MSDPFKDALRKAGECSDTPETNALDWSSAIGDTLEQRRTQLALIHGVTSRLERQRNEAIAAHDAACKQLDRWKQLYAEAVERGNLLQSQRDEAHAVIKELNKLREERETA